MSSKKFSDFPTKGSNVNGGFGAGGIYAKAVLNGSATIDPISLVDGAGETITIAVTGAALGDYAMFSPGVDLQGITVTAYVSVADVVSCRLQNETTGTIDLATSTWKAKVIQDGI